jgi:hypothetical protein
LLLSLLSPTSPSLLTIATTGVCGPISVPLVHPPQSSVTGQNVIRLPFCHSTVAVLTEPSLVVKIHNAPSTENPNIHVNDFTRELFGFEVTQGGSRSGVGFTYSPWKSMMEGKEGYENILRKVRVWFAVSDFRRAGFPQGRILAGPAFLQNLTPTPPFPFPPPPPSPSSTTSPQPPQPPKPPRTKQRPSPPLTWSCQVGNF